MSDGRAQQRTELLDGRLLGYAEYGATEGAPVFYFHGFNGSRLDYLLADAGDVARETNVRIIAADRPGMGLSTLQRGRQILDWPDDVTQLADALQIDRFAVLGISGGGPYAAACACKIPERLTATGIVCGMGPSDAPGMKDGASWTLPGQPSLIRRMVLMMTVMGLRRDPDLFLSRSKAMLAKVDGQLLERPEVAEVFMAGLQEAFREGIGGVRQEAALYTKPWEFRLQDIATEVFLWHGGLDKNVPVSVGRYVANAIPNCQASFFENEGHLALPHNRTGDILSTLVS